MQAYIRRAHAKSGAKIQKKIHIDKFLLKILQYFFILSPKCRKIDGSTLRFDKISPFFIFLFAYVIFFVYLCTGFSGCQDPI